MTWQATFDCPEGVPSALECLLPYRRLLPRNRIVEAAVEDVWRESGRIEVVGVSTVASVVVAAELAVASQAAVSFRAQTRSRSRRRIRLHPNPMEGVALAAVPWQAGVFSLLAPFAVAVEHAPSHRPSPSLFQSPIYPRTARPKAHGKASFAPIAVEPAESGQETAVSPPVIHSETTTKPFH